MNVGELVDDLMGVKDGVVDFEKEVISSEAPVVILTEQGAVFEVCKVEYESLDPDEPGTLWFHVREL